MVPDEMMEYGRVAESGLKRWLWKPVGCVSTSKGSNPFPSAIII